jgi:D-alanyl-D-alanine carboxypeptidase
MGDPEDLRDEMCNPKRKRPVAESDIDDDEEDETPPAPAAKGAKSKQVKHSLLVDLPPSMPPIRVFTGPVLKLPETNLGVAAAKDKKTEKSAAPAKSEAKPKATPATASAAAKPAAKPAAATPAQGSTPAAKPKS